MSSPESEASGSSEAPTSPAPEASSAAASGAGTSEAHGLSATSTSRGGRIDKNQKRVLERAYQCTRQHRHALPSGVVLDWDFEVDEGDAPEDSVESTKAAGKRKRSPEPDNASRFGLMTLSVRFGDGGFQHCRRPYGSTVYRTTRMSDALVSAISTHLTRELLRYRAEGEDAQDCISLVRLNEAQVNSWIGDGFDQLGQQESLSREAIEDWTKETRSSMPSSRGGCAQDETAETEAQQINAPTGASSCTLRFQDGLSDWVKHPHPMGSTLSRFRFDARDIQSLTTDAEGNIEGTTEYFDPDNPRRQQV